MTEKRRQGNLDSRRDVETSDYLEFISRVIRAAGRRVADSDAPELARLIKIRDELDQAIIAGVEGQRMMGRSWADIAVATGTSRQAAQQRWGAA